ncbi:hypothetical protein D3C87_1480970 [compost metagenome]
MFSIFIASTIASGCPASTVSPALTETEVMTPGIGQSSIFDVSGGSFFGINLASLATRGLLTRAITSTPRQRSLIAVPVSSTFTLIG